jgi:PAS domain S-box-containing protein
MNAYQMKEVRPAPVSKPRNGELPPGQTAIDTRRRARITGRVASKLIAAVAGSSSRLVRIAAHPIGASVCLALGYMVLCSAYIIFSGRLAAGAAWSLEQLRQLELLKGLAFVLVTGAAYFWFASRLLKRIAVQQQHLDLIFQGVSDCLFLLQVEADGCYRFLCANAAFLKMTGLTQEQVVGKRIEEVLPETSQALVKHKYQEVIRERKTVSWEETVTHLAGRRVGEVTVTPLVDKAGTVVQFAGVVRDITERKQAEEEVRQLSGHLLRLQDEERRRLGRELHDSTAQELAAVAMNLGLVQQEIAGREVAIDNRLADTQAIVEQCQRGIRMLSYQLHPPVLDEVGLAGAVREYADGFMQRSGIKVTLDASPALGRLPAETERALFRVVQEGLGNVHRHSGSQTAAIRIGREAPGVVLEIKDAGHGLPRTMLIRGDGSVSKSGVGIAGMRERLCQLGGRFEIESSGRGTTLRAIVPGKAGMDETPCKS